MKTSLLTENNLIALAIFSEQILVDGQGEIEAKESEIMNIQGANQVQLLATVSVGNSAGIRLKIVYSEDQLIWYQESMVDEIPTNGDVSHYLLYRVINDSGKYVMSIPVSASWMKVIATAITLGTGASISITATAASI